MKKIIQQRMESRQSRIADRLNKNNDPADMSPPMMRGPMPRYELSERTAGTALGGIGLIHQHVKELGLAEAIDERLHLFKIHLPYSLSRGVGSGVGTASTNLTSGIERDVAFFTTTNCRTCRESLRPFVAMRSASRGRHRHRVKNTTNGHQWS